MILVAIFIVYFMTISFDISESAAVVCEYKNYSYTGVGNVYACFINHGLTITTLDTAYIDSATGNHQGSFTNNDVNFLYFGSLTVSYFPRGLDTIFKNIKGIQFQHTKIKEIHQSDLKPFSKLITLIIYTSNLVEILEEGLFDYNPELEYIELMFNKISHVDSKVFDSLTKLKYLYFDSNTCINKRATDQTSVQNLITEIKSKCNNSDYSSLDQKLKFLESDSESLNLNDFKVELENLESMVNASKYVNFYQTKLNSLKSILANKLQETICSTLNEKFLNLTTYLKNLTILAENVSQGSNNEAASHQCMPLNDSFVNIVKNVDDKIVNLSKNVINVNQTVTNIEVQISSLKESFMTFSKEAPTKDNFAKISKNQAKFNDEIESINATVEDINKKLDEFKDSINSISSSTSEKVESESKVTTDVIAEVINNAVERIEKNLMEKLGENLKEINRKVDESEKRFNERTAKIMKALKVIFDVSDMALNYSLQ